MKQIAASVLVTGPTEDAVNIDTVKEFLRIDGDADDAALLVMIRGCVRRVEELLDRKLVSQTWDIFYDSFPFCETKDQWWDGVREGAIGDLFTSSEFIELPFGPLASLTSVKYTDEYGTELTFDPANYVADTRSPMGRVALKPSLSWPTTVLTPVNGVVIRGVFGWPTAAQVPDDIKQGLLSFIAKSYEHRGDEIPIMPSAALLMFEPYRKVKVG